MTIKLRFVLLLGLLIAAFFVALMLLRRAEAEEIAASRAALRESRRATLERWLELSGQPLRQMANDYSLWDDTVQFVLSPTEEWAQINLVSSLRTFGAAAYWVVNAEGVLVHHRRLERDAPALAPPLDAAAWVRLVREERFPWFFAESAVGLLEIRAAPIQPSEDSERRHAPYGWLTVARLWSDDHLNDLGRLVGDEVSLMAANAAPPSGPASLAFDRPLLGSDGLPVRRLRLEGREDLISRGLQTDEREARIFLGFGLLVLLALAVTLQTWVLRPVNALARALALRQPEPIERLQMERTEFGRVAQLVERAFEQQRALELEVEHRNRVEAALREKDASLREANEERVRLGRNLHDSVIQSIFASGLGLSAVRALLRENPAEAERRLEQVRSTLNETIRDLRNFIIGLEPEALRRMSLTDAVHALVDLLRTAAPIEVTLDINEPAADRLSPAHRADLLQIIREALSNVLRHSDASAVRVTLALRSVGITLVVDDNGRGFDPEKARGTGNGLTNMQERAAAAGATLLLDAAPGKGTRVCVSFPLTPPLP